MVDSLLSIRRMARFLSIAVLTLGIGLGMADASWAQPGKKASQTKTAERGYVIPYALTLLSAAMGIAVACIPSKRKDEVKILED